MANTIIDNAGKEMMVYQPDNLQPIEVRVAEETVLLTQAQMTEFNEQHVQVVEQKLDISLEGSRYVNRDEVSGRECVSKVSAWKAVQLLHSSISFLKISFCLA